MKNLLFFSTCITAIFAQLSCLDKNGQSTQWWLMYRLPMRDMFIYVDPNTPVTVEPKVITEKINQFVDNGPQHPLV